MDDVPRTLIVGANSFIGGHLLTAYQEIHPSTIGTTRRPSEPGLAYLDLEIPNLDSLDLKGYGAAILAAAVSRVVPCEGDPEGTRRVNVTGTLRLIEQLRARNIVPVFLSTDYVFDGASTTGYADDAPRCPCTEYGRHKAEVEQAFEASGAPFLVLRLSKIYSLERGDGSLLDEMASHLLSGRGYSAAHDQVFCPTYVRDLAPAIMELQRKGATGIFNFCADEAWSRYDIARAVAQQVGLSPDVVQRVSLDDLPGSFCRPKCTVLRPERLQRETSIRLTPLSTLMPRFGS